MNHALSIYVILQSLLFTIQLTYNKKYKEYINSYRTQHAQKMLTDKDAAKYTMYAIAYDSGFNSESTFYSVFKQQTGATPKQYQDSNKNRAFE